MVGAYRHHDRICIYRPAEDGRYKELLLWNEQL